MFSARSAPCHCPAGSANLVYGGSVMLQIASPYREAGTRIPNSNLYTCKLVLCHSFPNCLLWIYCRTPVNDKAVQSSAVNIYAAYLELGDPIYILPHTMHLRVLWGFHYSTTIISLNSFNLLATELIFFYFSTPVYKMLIIREPNTLELWNKLHFEVEKTESIYHV